MEAKKLSVSFVALFALAILMVASVSAFGSITSVRVADVETINGGVNIAAFAGQSLPVRVIFDATANASDVRIKAWVSGEQDYSVSTDRFNVVESNTYSRMLSVQVPSNVKPTENLELYITVESRNDGIIGYAEINLAAQRGSYTLDLLDASMNSEVKAGQNLAIDVVLKNMGMNLAEDAFVKASIPSLGIETRAYYGDLSAQDQADPDRSDSVSKRLYLSIPSSAASGVYAVQIEAYDGDATTTATKSVSISGAASDSGVVSNTASQTFAVGEKASYSLTLVNTGDKIAVYNIVPEASSDLTVSLADSVIVVPAGESKSINVGASAAKQGKYNFAVGVYSDGELVKRYNFGANVEGTSSGSGFAANTTVLLTVVLAIIFVVLLVVLIVLLTKKPEKAEEFGESYY